MRWWPFFHLHFFLLTMFPPPVLWQASFGWIYPYQNIQYFSSFILTFGNDFTAKPLRVLQNPDMSSRSITFHVRVIHHRRLMVQKPSKGIITVTSLKCYYANFMKIASKVVFSMDEMQKSKIKNLPYSSRQR